MLRGKNKIHQTSVEGFAFLLGSVSLAVYSLVLHVGSKAKWKMSPYLFPLLLAVFLFLLSLSLLQEGKKERREQEEENPEKQGLVGEGPLQYMEAVSEQGIPQKKESTHFFTSLREKPWKDAIVFALLSLVYILGITLVGFVVSTTLFLAVSFVHLKERRVYLILVLSVSFPLIVYVLFGMLLHVMLP
jgi:hypothetical protein